MFDLRYMPQTAVIKKMIENGELGDVHIISFTGQHFLDYGNRPWWYFEEGKHGGTINDIAIHGIDLLKFVTGKSLTHIDCARCFNAFIDEIEGKDTIIKTKGIIESQREVLLLQKAADEENK